MRAQRERESTVPDTKTDVRVTHSPAPEEKPPILWVQTTVFAVTFLVAAIGVPWYALSVGFEWSAIIAFAVFCMLTGRCLL